MTAKAAGRARHRGARARADGGGDGHAIVEFSRRHADFAVAGAAVSGGAIALFGVADTPVRATEAERMLAADGGASGRGRRGRGDRRAASPRATSTAAAPTAAAWPAACVERALGARAGRCVMRIATTVNGVRYERDVEPRLLLVDFLREDLGLVGTHIGCEHGVCGTCTVLMNGETIRSCITFAVQADGAGDHDRRGPRQHGEMHPLQEAFWEKQGLQCGYCTPGMLLRALGDPRREPGPDAARRSSEAIASNLCRCTGYQFIVDAVLDAADAACGDGGAAHDHHRAAAPHARSTTRTASGSASRSAALEDPKFLLGKGGYIDDLRVRGMLHAALLRSPHAHARIVVDRHRARPRRCPACSRS